MKNDLSSHSLWGWYLILFSIIFLIVNLLAATWLVPFNNRCAEFSQGVYYELEEKAQISDPVAEEYAAVSNNLKEYFDGYEKAYGEYENAYAQYVAGGSEQALTEKIEGLKSIYEEAEEKFSPLEQLNRPARSVASAIAKTLDEIATRDNYDCFEVKPNVRRRVISDLGEASFTNFRQSVQKFCETEYGQPSLFEYNDYGDVKKFSPQFLKQAYGYERVESYSSISASLHSFKDAACGNVADYAQTMKWLNISLIVLDCIFIAVALCYFIFMTVERVKAKAGFWVK